MHNWVVEPEYISCVVLAILFVYANFQRFAVSPKQTAFRCSIIISLAAIVVNIGSIHCIEDPYRFPMWLNYSVNSWYFALTLMMVGSISLAGLMLVYEDRYDRAGFRNAVLAHGVLYVLALLITLSNGRTGLLFYFTDDNTYMRGPLNKIVLPLLLACVLINVICFIRERPYVNRAFRRILGTLPPITVLFGLIQALSPNVMLTGSAATISLLILFINGQLQRLNTDQLTDLGSRELFYRLIERNVVRGRPFHVIVVCMRNYKDVNNRFGQRGGDAFLRSIGEYLQSIDKADACRFTGVEFAVIAYTQDEAAYEAVYQALRDRFHEPWRVNGMETTLSAAYADIAYPETVSDTNEVIASLEYATRLAKQRGEDATVRFDKQLKGAFGRRNYIIERLKTGLLEQSFFLNMQPVYDCKAGRLNGAEVLVRLREESGSLIPPMEFIPLAEETGDVVDVGWFVIEHVLRFLSEHRDLPIQWLSVNISAQQYLSPGFVERIEALMRRYEAGRGVLKLEITERMILDDIDRARSVMLDLKAIGVGTGLDDFGTGYSNLANVMSLPFEVVKIDKSYVDNVETNRYAYGLLETIIKGIRALDMLVLAEGVETQAQVDIMSRLGVDHIQGFYFAKPMEDEAFVEAISQQNTETAAAISDTPQ